MKLFLLILCSFVSVIVANGQEKIVAQDESLALLAVGKGKGAVEYSYDSDGNYSVGSPYVDATGRLIFADLEYESRYFFFQEGVLFDVDSKNTKSPVQSLVNSAVVQQGMMRESAASHLVWSGRRFELFEYYGQDSQARVAGDTWSEPAPWGAYIWSPKNRLGVALQFDVRHPENAAKVIGSSDFTSWISTQIGGFTIGDDGLIYRNGMIWTARQPDSVISGWRNAGRLMSGHSVWTHSDRKGELSFSIVNSRKEVELELVVNLDAKFDYTVGPWGEIYALEAPPRDKVASEKVGYGVYIPIADMPAKLVVIRNQLKYFGRLNDGGVRLRKDPMTTGEILGTYPAKTGFRILETGTKQETIGGQKNVWYKVRLLDGKEGWFFGSFVQNLYDGPNGKAPPWPNVPDW